MSLGYTFVLCADGLLYEDLTYRDPEKRWFICFDESDPDELVIKDKAKLNPRDVLKSIGIESTAPRKYRKAGRLFGTNKFHDSTSYSFKLTKDPPTPRPGIDKWDWRGTVKQMRKAGMCGTYCGFPESVEIALGMKRRPKKEIGPTSTVGGRRDG